VISISETESRVAARCFACAALPLFEITLVLVRRDHVASLTVVLAFFHSNSEYSVDMINAPRTVAGQFSVAL